MPIDKKREVVDALIDFIKRASQENATPQEVAVLPEVAKILLSLQSEISR